MKTKICKINVGVYELTNDIYDFVRLQDLFNWSIRVEIENDAIKFHFPDGEAGKIGDYLIMYPKKIYDILHSDELDMLTNCDFTEASQMKDGIYLIKKEGIPVLFTPDCDKKNCVAVGIKMGSKSIAVALKDAAGGENITLTDSEDETEYDGYIDNYTDAVTDWSGKANTKHLEKIGLNKSIKLEAGQYIPSVGEMYLIYLHKKALNEALEAVGGESIADDWYWTSTEYSAAYAWYLYLNVGTLSWGDKASASTHVRAVSAF